MEISQSRAKTIRRFYQAQHSGCGKFRHCSKSVRKPVVNVNIFLMLNLILNFMGVYNMENVFEEKYWSTDFVKNIIYTESKKVS
jgi:hypothetical protein